MKEGKIIIIDDDYDHCDNLCDILSMYEYEVEICTSCAEAEKLFFEINPQVAIIDINLPDGSGIELLGSLKAKKEDCFFIMATAFADLNTAVDSLAMGAYQYLFKPLRPEELIKIIEHIFELINLREKKKEAEISLKKRNADLEEINRRLKMVVQSSQGLKGNEKTLAPMLLEEFARNMMAGGGSIFLRDKDCLVLVHTLDKKHVPSTIAFPLKKGSLFEKVLRRKEPVLINDFKKFSSSGWSGYKNESALIFPLMDSEGHITGIISLHDKISPPFTLQDKEIGSLLASYSSEKLIASHAVNALEESEEKYKSFIASSPDPVIVYDNERRVQFFNNSFSELFGWNSEECKGKKLDDFIPDIASTETEYLLQKESKGENCSNLETVRNTIDGKQIPVSISNSILKGKDGEKKGIVSTIRDITEQKQMERHLVQSQKMEAIGTLAGGVAHDFNNILSAVFGYLDLAIMDLPEGLKVRDNILKVQQAAFRAKDLVHQILSFSRQEKKGREPVYLHLILKEALLLLRASLPSTIVIDQRINTKTGVILADSSQMHQLIMNLGTNAGYAMKQKDNGVLEVSLDEINIDEIISRHYHGIAPGHYLKLKVRDNGTGIDPYTIKRIFDPYFTTKEKGVGTGLGLSVVQKIVADHDGVVIVHSSYGHWTEFNMVFPIIDTEIILNKKVKEIPGKGEGSILFIDDEKWLAELGQLMLERLGYRVSSFTDPEEALAVYKKSPGDFDLIITDMTMPNITGGKLAVIFKKIREDIPIIICTGFINPDFSEKLLGINVDEILLKPLGINELSKAVQKFLPILKKK